MTILYFLLACMLALVVCSVRIGASVNYNILQNLGHVRLSIFYLPIFSRDISFYGKYLAVNKECKHALQIKIEIDKPSIQFAKDITKVIKDIIKKYAYLSDIKIDFNTKEEVLVSADLHRIEQVMYNLINNAINHVGEDKTVTININKNRIEVSDTGEGIDPKDINHIWKRYYKIDKTHRRDKVGTGIGLSIVATILKQHNFKYGVNSIKNKKTTFWFEFDQK